MIHATYSDNKQNSSLAKVVFKSKKNITYLHNVPYLRQEIMEFGQTFN